MLVVTEQVVEKYRYVVDNFALPVAKIVRGVDVVAGNVIVIVDLPSVSVIKIECMVVAVSEKALGRFKGAAPRTLC